MEKKVNLQFDEREGRPTSILWLRRWGSLTLHPSPPPPPPDNGAPCTPQGHSHLGGYYFDAIVQHIGLFISHDYIYPLIL